MLCGSWKFMSRILLAISLVISMPGFFHSASVASERAGPSYVSEIDCDERPTISDMMHCEQLRTDDAEQRMHEAYAKLKQALPANLVQKLEVSQESWAAYRDANFDFAASLLSKIGRKGLYRQIKAMRRLTEKRSLELEALLERSKGVYGSLSEPDFYETLPGITLISSETEADMLLGYHPLRLQWLGEEPHGTVFIRKKDDVLLLEGEQRNVENSIELRGVITEVRSGSFVFEGRVVSEVSHINQGRPCLRKGVFLFLRRNGRPFWRMQDIGNPCADVVDYIDIFVRGQ